jgi:hypothetical protein
MSWMNRQLKYYICDFSTVVCCENMKSYWKQYKLLYEMDNAL